MTMATTTEKQVAMDDVLVLNTQRDLYVGILGYSLCASTLYPIQDEQQETHSVKNWKKHFSIAIRHSKTLQVVYDVLRNSPLFRAFQVPADVPEIYMQEFWATAKLHHHSIRFKIDTKKNCISLPLISRLIPVNPYPTPWTSL
nr:hypothetical protein [Tanacetum cinerariifolium]